MINITEKLQNFGLNILSDQDLLIVSPHPDICTSFPKSENTCSGCYVCSPNNPKSQENWHKLRHALINLKTDPDLRFTVLADLFGADFPHRYRRFEIGYNLLSMKLNKRIIIKTWVSEDEAAQSVMDIFPVANWYEREVFDFFGVSFSGHKDMRRILTDYGFKGHPLRKDFPVTGHVEVRYDSETQKVVYEPVKLTQDFRSFDFISPWVGAPRD